MFSEWFDREFGPFGFSLTPTIYDPCDFTPKKGILYTNKNGVTTKLKTMIDPTMVDLLCFMSRCSMDLYGGYHNNHPWEKIEVKETLMHTIMEDLKSMGIPFYGFDLFTPKKRMPKFKL